VLTNVEELERALDYPWEKVDGLPASGPARLCRTRLRRPGADLRLGRNRQDHRRAAPGGLSGPPARRSAGAADDVLVDAGERATLGRLAGNEPDVHGRISVHSITGIGHTLYADLFGEPIIASDALIGSLLDEAAKKVGGHRFSVSFMLGEWTDIVDAWQLKSWEGYRNVARLGRKTRIGGKQRELLWSIFADVRAELDKRGKITASDMFARVTAHFEGGCKAPFDYAVVDKAQDIGVAPLRFLVALGASRPDSLFFAGDLGQRIFQAPFSWKALGVDIRGRSHTLRINYRTSDRKTNSAGPRQR
jgi:hypothetical protein